MSHSPSAPKSRRRLLRHPLVLTGIAVLVVAAAIGAYWFQPWKLFTNNTVDEAPPSVTASSNDGPAPAAPVVESQGTFVSQEHDTTGTAKLLRLADGSQVVRIENLDTSDGPLLKVWLTDAPVTPGTDGARVFDDGRWIDLGALKGNRGSANYPVPAGTAIEDLNSVSIWCDRFDVSFGAAALKPVPATQ